MSNKRTFLIASAAALGALSILSGCANHEYLDRHDRITLGAGDAVARNKAVQTINPRPRHAYRTHIHFDGERIRSAMDSYHKVSNTESADSNTQSSPENADLEPSDAPPQ